MVSPHAGYTYSGPVAGYAFGAVKGLSPDVVVVISPMHQPYFEPLLTSAHEAYYTPLGEVPIARNEIQELDVILNSQIGFGISPVKRDREHSLEIELPFLQRSVSGDFKLIPIMMRDQTNRVAQALGEALAKILDGKNTLLVGSTDLSHFHPHKKANEYDQELLRRIAAFDPEAVINAESEGAGFACGRAAVAAVLWAARSMGANNVKILNYATSGDVNGDYNQVVGYGAAVVTKK